MMKLNYCSLKINYDLAAEFFDHRGALIKAGVKSLGSGCSVSLSHNGDLLIIEENTGIADLEISPIRSEINRYQLGDIADMKELTERFCEHMGEIYREFSLTSSEIMLTFRGLLPHENAIDEAVRFFDAGILDDGSSLTRVGFTSEDDHFRRRVTVRSETTFLLLEYVLERIDTDALEGLVELVDRCYDEARSFYSNRLGQIEGADQ